MTLTRIVWSVIASATWSALTRPKRSTGNSVKRNGRKRDRDSGIELEDSDRNLVDGNRVRGNADGLTDVIRCISGDENVGSNVPRHCR